MIFPRLKDLREDSDNSQKAIARYLNIAQNSYSNYETGVRNIPLAVLIQLALSYDTSTDYLSGITDVIKPYPRKIQYEGGPGALSPLNRPERGEGSSKP